MFGSRDGAAHSDSLSGTTRECECTNTVEGRARPAAAAALLRRNDLALKLRGPNYPASVPEKCWIPKECHSILRGSLD